jgi:PAS domain S-box-containing protein
MNKKKGVDSEPPRARDLRREAEQRLRDKKATPVEGMAEVDVRALLHELQVHQIELEMQNEELLRAQTAVQEVSDRYQDLFDFAPIGYFLLDEQSQILEINLAGAALLGLDRSTAVRQRLGQFVAMEHRGAFTDFCKRVLATNAKQTCEIELRRNEEPVYAFVEGIPTQEGKENRSLRVTVTDISDRRRAEQEIRSIAEFPEENPNPVIRASSDGSVLYANAPALRLLEAMGWQAGRPLPEELLRQTRCILEASEKHEFDLLSPAGRTFSFAVAPSSRVGQVHLYAHDITKRKKAEEELRQSRDELQAIYDGMIDGLLVADTETKRFVRTNAATSRLLGYSEDELLSMSIIDIHPPAASVSAILEQFKALAEGRLAVATDAPLLRKDGVVIYANISCKVVVYNGRPCAIGFFHDITQRKQVEAEIRTLNQTLEKRVAERTAELAERAEQLRALAVELTQAEQRERRRLAQVLHDHLQQLLVAARMKIGLLRRRVPDEQYSQTIAQLDELLGQTIDEARSLAVQLCPPVLYEHGLAAALEWLARQTHEKFDLAVEVQTDPAAEPSEETIQVFLFQAAGELLLNVAKHAQARRVQVRMTRVLVQPSRLAPGAGETPAPQGPEQVCIEVCDDGVGFDPAQVAGKTSGGFGMFSICQRLELFDGHLEVFSSPGQGTRATIRVPLGKAAVSSGQVTKTGYAKA